MKLRTGPPFFSGNGLDRISDKWLLLFKVTAIYSIFAPTAVFIIYISGNLHIEIYKSVQNEFFYPLSKFGNFFRSAVLQYPILEESFFRGPVWILSACGVSIRHRLGFFLIWAAIIFPTAYWALNHTVLVIQVFIAGVGWGWLTYRTKSLWPAIASHALANALIYFGIKFAGLFLKI